MRGDPVKAAFLSLIAFTAWLPALAQPSPQSPAPRTLTVPVAKEVSLEVLDWGGAGRPLILLEGLGGVAHDYDSFAPRFTAQYHVYGITRRGFGGSSKPAPSPVDYSAEVLGQDVLKVIEALHLDRPVLAGQSIAGEELSWIGTFHPDKAAALIYLEAVDSYSFYDPADTAMTMDMVDVRQAINAFEAGEPLSPAVLDHIRDSAAALARSSGRLAYNIEASGGQGDPAPPAVGLAVIFGEQRFTAVRSPFLAVMACPHDFSGLARQNLRAAAALKERDEARCRAQIASLKAHYPSGQVVVIPNADHQIVRTREADVVRAMQAYLSAVK